MTKDELEKIRENYLNNIKSMPERYSARDAFNFAVELLTKDEKCYEIPEKYCNKCEYSSSDYTYCHLYKAGLQGTYGKFYEVCKPRICKAKKVYIRLEE